MTSSQWGFTIGTFIVSFLLSLALGIYVVSSGGFQPGWVPFSQTVATIASLLVTFSGLMYVNAMNSIKESKRAFWELSEEDYSPITRTAGGLPERETLETMQESFKNVKELFDHIAVVTKLMENEMRNILMAWAACAVGAMLVILLSFPSAVVTTAFVVSVFALLFEATQFGVFVGRTRDVISIEATDAKVSSVSDVLDEAERRSRSQEGPARAS